MASLRGQYKYRGLFLLLCCSIFLHCQYVSSLNTAIFTVGGLVEGKESPLLLIENNVCPDLPALPQRRLAGLLGNLNDSIIFCGGREDLLRLNNECWIYEPKLQEWVEIEPLPRALAGATAITMDDTLWVFGGVKEEDFYTDVYNTEDYQSTEKVLEYYDYFVEETGNDVFFYDLDTKKWQNLNNGLPMNIQGSCAVQAFNETILILGGKNEQNFSHGSNMIWPFDPVNGSFESPTQWPSMRFDRYFHGCSVIEYNGVPYIIVVGGLGECQEISENTKKKSKTKFHQNQNHFHSKNEDSCSRKVEILPLPTNDDFDKAIDGNLAHVIAWKPLADLNYPHAFMPAVGKIDGMIFVIGGGQKKIEIFEESIGKWASIGHIQPRFFGSSLTLPRASWMESCKLEPNLGIHDYYQAKTKEKLKGKQWLCFGENLVISDQDAENLVHSKGVTSEVRISPESLYEGCTVPSCHYPHPFRHVSTFHKRSTSVTCNVFDLGKASSRVECHLECQKHWKPINDTTVTTCYPETSRNDHFYGSKLTNFTIDYLECQRMDD